MKAIMLLAAVVLVSACTPRESEAQKQIKRNKIESIEMDRRDAEAAKL